MTIGPEPPPALERVMERYARMVRQLSRQRGLAEADVDEVLQDVRIRLWRALPGARMAEVRTSYVYRTAMSAVCDQIRRRRSASMESLDDLPAGQAGDLAMASPDEAFERRELGRRIGLALADLSETRRPVVRMYLAGYPPAEIQALMGWTEAKTRNLLYRGLGELRLALGRLGVGPEVAR